MLSKETLGKISHLLVVISLSLGSIFYSTHFPVHKKTLVNPHAKIQPEKILGFKDFSLKERWPNEWVNDIFKKNILLNLAYLRGIVTNNKINWDQVLQPFTYEFKLLPNQTFAFHDDVESFYQGKVVKTTNAHFNAQEGFKSDGYLFGDGVCHLASLMYWAAKEANLSAIAPTRHDFAKIAEVPKEFGVSIYSNPANKGSNSKQNLYITNNKSKPVVFRFNYKDDRVKIAVLETN